MLGKELPDTTVMTSAALRSGNQPFCPYLEEKGGPNKTELSALNGSKNEKGSCKRKMQAPQSGRTSPCQCSEDQPALERVAQEDALVSEESGTLTISIAFVPMGGCRHLTQPTTTNATLVGSGLTVGWSPVALVSRESSGSPSPTHEQPQFNDACPSLPQSSRKSILSRLSHRHHHRVIPVLHAILRSRKKGDAAALPSSRSEQHQWGSHLDRAKTKQDNPFFLADDVDDG